MANSVYTPIEVIKEKFFIALDADNDLDEVQQYLFLRMMKDTNSRFMPHLDENLRAHLDRVQF